MRERFDNISGVVLAGGNNSRMGGRNKAFIEIHNTPIIQRTLDLLRGMFEEIILVTNSPEQFVLYESSVVITQDVVTGIGPLGGIHSGLSSSSREGIFCVACDMPALQRRVMQRQIDIFNEIGCDAVVPRNGSFIEPLHAVYRTNMKDNLRSFIENSTEFSIRSFLATAGCYYWDLSDNPFYWDTFRNINSPEDLREAVGREKVGTWESGNVTAAAWAPRP